MGLRQLCFTRHDGLRYDSKDDVGLLLMPMLGGGTSRCFGVVFLGKIWREKDIGRNERGDMKEGEVALCSD